MTTTATRRKGARSATTAGRVPVAYERISQFREDRLGVEVSRGVDRQADDAVRCADELGLGAIAPEHHYTDNNRSASQFATRERERWLELLAFVRSGGASHVLVWLWDRAFRTTEAASELLSAAREGGALLVQTAGSYTVADPSNPDDILRLKLAGLLAEYEVAKMSIRQRRSKAQAAADGKPHGGRRAFGYEDGYTAVRESEAVYVREVASRLLAGESLRACAQFLNDQGVPLPSGGTKWTGPNLGQLIRRPLLAGLRVSGKDADGQAIVVGEATWPGIIDVPTHEALVGLLTDPERRTNKGTNDRVYLLTNLGTCAECGQILRGSIRNVSRTHPERGRRAVYICASGRHVHRSQVDVDHLLNQRVVARLEVINADGRLLVDSTAADLVAALSERLVTLRRQLETRADELEEADASPQTIAASMGALERKIAKVDGDLKLARASARRPEAALEGMTGSEAGKAWASASLSRRRAVLELLYESISLRGAGANKRRDLEAADLETVPRKFPTPGQVVGSELS